MIIVRAKYERLFYRDSITEADAIGQVKEFYGDKKAVDIITLTAVKELDPEAIKRFWNWVYQVASPTPILGAHVRENITISEVISDLLQSLPDRHRELVIRHLGLLDTQPQRNVDIAADLGISRARVSQIINKSWWMIYQTERRAKLNRFIKVE